MSSPQPPEEAPPVVKKLDLKELFRLKIQEKVDTFRKFETKKTILYSSSSRNEKKDEKEKKKETKEEKKPEPKPSSQSLTQIPKAPPIKPKKLPLNKIRMDDVMRKTMSTTLKNRRKLEELVQEKQGITTEKTSMTERRKQQQTELLKQFKEKKQSSSLPKKLSKRQEKHKEIEAKTEEVKKTEEARQSVEVEKAFDHRVVLMQAELNNLANQNRDKMEKLELLKEQLEELKNEKERQDILKDLQKDQNSMLQSLTKPPAKQRRIPSNIDLQPVSSDINLFNLSSRQTSEPTTKRTEPKFIKQLTRRKSLLPPPPEPKSSRRTRKPRRESVFFNFEDFQVEPESEKDDASKQIQNNEQTSEMQRANQRELLNTGVATNEYRDTYLLDKKMSLIKQLKQSQLNFSNEMLGRDSLKYMLERLQGQQKYEVSMIRELDPYFQFQNKIFGTLNNLRTGKESRTKLKDSKIRVMKQQLRDKKQSMANILRIRCNELAELEKENKRQKTKIMGAGASNANTSTFKDTTSVGASTKNPDAMAGLTLKKEKQEDVTQIEEEEEEKEKNLEISLDNFLEMNDFIELCLTIKDFYLQLQKLKDAGQAQSEAIVAEMRTKLAEKKNSKEREKLIQLKIFLSQKPPKGIVHFQKDKGSSLPAHKLNSIQKYQEKQAEAKQLFFEQKEQLERLMKLPQFYLTTGLRTLFQKTQFLLEDKKKKYINLKQAEENSLSEIDQNRVKILKTLGMSSIMMSPKEETDTQRGINEQFEALENQKPPEQVNLELESQPFPKSNEEIAASAEASASQATEEKPEKSTEVEDLDEFLQFLKIKEHWESIAKSYNERISQDTILQVDIDELNMTKSRLLGEQRRLKDELKEWTVNLRYNMLFDVSDKTYLQKEQSATGERKLQIEEADLLNDIIQKKYTHPEAEAGVSPREVNHHREVRQMPTPKEILTKNLVEQQEIEQMYTDHDHFKQLVSQIRQIYDKIRLQCNEQTNSFAYRIHLVFDVTEIEYSDKDLESIIKRYQRFWPYEPIDFDVQEEAEGPPPPKSSTEILKNLAKFEGKDAKRKAELAQQKRKKMKGRIQQGLTEFQQEMMSSALWIAFQQKIEIKMLFLHQRKFIAFLLKNIKQLRQPTGLMQAFAMKNLALKGKLLAGNRKALAFDEFVTEYRTFLKVNNQNMKQINEQEKQETETPQQAVQLQQLIMQEEKHFEDFYKKNKKGAAKATSHSEDQKKTTFNSSASLFAKNSSIEKILRQVNQDKCNYSKLLSYEMQDVDFIQEFIRKANAIQNSDLLKLPDQDTQQEHKGAKKGAGLATKPPRVVATSQSAKKPSPVRRKAESSALVSRQSMKIQKVQLKKQGTEADKPQVLKKLSLKKPKSRLSLVMLEPSSSKKGHYSKIEEELHRMLEEKSRSSKKNKDLEDELNSELKKPQATSSATKPGTRCISVKSSSVTKLPKRNKLLPTMPSLSRSGQSLPSLQQRDWRNQMYFAASDEVYEELNADLNFEMNRQLTQNQWFYSTQPSFNQAPQQQQFHSTFQQPFQQPFQPSYNNQAFPQPFQTSSAFQMPGRSRHGDLYGVAQQPMFVTPPRYASYSPM